MSTPIDPRRANRIAGLLMLGAVACAALIVVEVVPVLAAATALALSVGAYLMARRGLRAGHDADRAARQVDAELDEGPHGRG